MLDGVADSFGTVCISRRKRRQAGEAMTQSTADTSLRYSLDTVPRQKRSRTWTDTLNSFFYEYDFRLPDDFSNGMIEGCYAGDLSIASIESDAMTVYRTNSHVSCDALDAYFVLLPMGSEISLSQNNREAIVPDRKFSLVSTSEAYTYIQMEYTRFNNLIIPGKLLRQFTPKVENALAMTSKSDSISRIFADFANSLCLGLDGTDAHTRDVLSRQTVELLGLVLDGADHGSGATPIKWAHYRRIAKIIDRQFSDPAFGIEDIVKQTRLSQRYIQDIFAENQTTVTEAIRRRRIAEACRLILRRRQNHPSITEIAFIVGFVDLAHFSRVFKNVTGMSPTTYNADYQDKDRLRCDVRKDC